MKVTFKGIVKKGHQLEQYGNTKVLRIEVMEPGRVNEFGDKIGNDQTHLINVLNKNIEKLPANMVEAAQTNDVEIDQGGKAELVCYVNSRTFEHEGRQVFRTELSLADITFI